MINFNGINPNIVTKYQTNNKPQAVKHNTPAVSFSGNEYKEIGFTEGLNLLGNGIIKQVSGVFSSIIQHPMKTLALVGGTTLGLMALPVIGIPTAVGAGVLAAGFGALALGKGVYHAVQFAKNNEEGTYDIARKNLEQIGGDTVDLALSAPFVPKAISNIKNFAKYGKIGYNTTLINELKTAKTVKNKWTVLKNTDAELSRNINYQNAVDKELAKLNSLSNAQKADIKKELLDFNVPTDKISEVVLDKWAQIKGIKAKPDLKYETLPTNTGGHATPKDCSITINDRKAYIPNKTFQDYKLLKSELVDGKYINTYKHVKTGNLVQDTIDKQILDAYTDLYVQQKNLTAEAKQILTTVHEREHIHQYAQITAHKGKQWANPSARADALYQQMIQDMKPVQAGSVEAQQIEALASATNNGTPISYIKNAREIGARQVEAQAMTDANLQRLDNVFAKTNKAKPTPTGNTLLVNGLRVQSAGNNN